MYTKLLKSVFIGCLFAVSFKAAEPLAPVELLAPADYLRYDGELVTIVVKASADDIDTVVIEVDNNSSYELKADPKKETYCKTVTIEKGANIITVTNYLKGLKVQQSQRHIFFLPELYEGFDDDPEEYEEGFFHVEKKEKVCASCHNMTSNIPTGDKVFDDVSQTTCYTCHKSIVSKRNSHAPAINWRCTDCHDGKLGAYDTPSEDISKYMVRDPVNKMCEQCHEKAKQWDNNRYVHGPVNDGRCERCHNPHGSDNAFFLRKPIWKLCTTCHAEKASGKHVISSFVFGSTHPTQGKPDPSRPGRELVCSGCHNPHGSSGVSLLRMKGSVPFNVCQRCHDKR